MAVSVLAAALWGDSLGRGIVFDEARQRYAVAANTFAKILKQRGILDIDNHSRFGATVTDGLADFRATKEIAADTVAIQYGGNDCNLSWEQVAADPGRRHPSRNDLAQFESQLVEFAQEVRARGLRPVLVTPPPLIAPRFFAWVSKGLDASAILRYLGDVAHIYRWQERYALSVGRAARAADCELFDLRDVFLEADDLDSLYCPDGMHPNEKAQGLIADAIEKAISCGQYVSRLVRRAVAKGV